MADQWKFLLCNSSDLSFIRELRNAHDRTLNVDINKSGSASGWLPMSDKAASLIQLWSTCIVAQYGSTIFWSGPISNRRISYAQGRVSFNAVGWFDRLMNFLVQDNPSVQYANQDAGAIASSLIGKARAQDPHLPITMGSVTLTQNRTITYQRDQNIGQAINDLVQLESGFDWYIDPVTRQFNVVAQLGQDRPSCKWSFIADGQSQQSNLADLEVFEDGTAIVNWIAPRGQYGTITPVQEPVSQDAYGVFMEAPSISDVVDSNILTAYANAELVYRAQPRVTYTLTPKSSAKVTVPRLFRSFNIGDTTYLTARRDQHVITDQAVRIFGVTLAIQDNGAEVLSNLQTTAGG